MAPSLRTGILIAAAGALALAAGFATYNLIGGGPGAALRAQLMSDESDVASLMATRLADVDGKETPFAEVTGQVTVVNFWATWCAPCLEEIPDFVKLQDEYRDRGVRFVGIAAEKPAKVPAFVRDMKINYTILIGDAAAIELARKLGDKAGALPFTIVLDKDRKLVHRELGVFRPGQLRGIFAKYL